MPCKILDLGAIEALTYYAVDFMKAISKPDALQQLTLASIKFDPSHYPIMSLDSSLMQKFTSLQVFAYAHMYIYRILLTAHCLFCRFFRSIMIV